MNKTISQSVAFDVIFNTARGSETAKKALEKFHEDAAKAGFGAGIKEGAKQVEDSFSEAVAKAVAVGATGLDKALGASLKKHSDEMLAVAEKVKDLDDRINSTHSVEQKKALKKEREALVEHVKTLQNAQRVRIAQLDRSTERQVEAFKAGAALAARDWQDNVVSSGEVFTNTVSKGLSGLDVTDLASNFVANVGGGLKGLTGMAGKKAHEMAAGGDEGKMQQMIAAFSRGAMVIAGVTAAVAGLVAIFGAAYGQTKEFNKNILEGSSALDIMGTSVFNTQAKLSTSLESIRKASEEVAMETRQSTDDVIKMLTAFNDAGVTFKEMGGFVKNAGSEMEAYSEMARFATTSSLTLGVSVQEIAKSTDYMMKDMGMGFDMINDSFGSIYASAGKAGMNVKDFFTSVNEATSGMALYNVRLEDTVGLMLALTKTLGQQRAQDLMGQKGAYKDKGTLDKAKDVMIAGKGGNIVMDAVAEKQMKAFSAKMTPEILDIMKNVTKGGQGEELDEKMIAKLSMGEVAGLKDELTKILGAPGQALGSQLRNLVKVQRAAQEGGLGNMTAALGKMDQTGDMAMKMVGAFGLLGDKTMGQMSMLSREAYEKTVGLSGEAFDTFAELQEDIAYGIAKQQGGKAEDVKASEIAALIAGPVEELQKILTPEQIGDLKKEAPLAESSMERMARSQLTETTSISSTLKNTMTGLLETISGWLESLVNWFTKDDVKAAARTVAISDTDDKISSLYAQQSSMGENLAALKKSAATEMDPNKKKDLALEIETKELDLKSTQEELKEARTKAKLLARGATAEQASLESETGFKTQVELAAHLQGEGVSTEGQPLQEKGWLDKLGFHGVQAMTQPKVETEALKGLYKTTKEKKKKDEELAKVQRKENAEQAAKNDKALSLINETAGEGFPSLKDAIEAGYDIDAAKDMFTPELVAAFQKRAPGSKANLEAKIREDGVVSQQESKSYAALGGHIDVTGGVEDFVYRGNAGGGRITPINTQDQFLGMKPDGPVAKAMSGGGGGTVNIHIHGGDENKIYAVVKKAIKDAGIQA